MKIYLVGGAVRDQLLGLPIKERDWVVVGGQPEDLERQGYRQVGRDFPVFLHPESKEEYALARLERKRGSGYYGFVCDFNPGVTLEEDLARRDLTINAMAMDNDGQVIDPYQGRYDLEHKILRHVSKAFVEDPVRVLRVARFAARFHHLGFRLADETRMLMQQMVRGGELAQLVPERVWQEWQQSLQERNPALFILTLRACGALRVVFPEIDALFGVPAEKKHHPEVDTGIHSLLALEAAVFLSSDPVVRFAALVHDLGKAATPMQDWPSQLHHAELGITVIEALCDRVTIPKRYQKLALMASQWHVHIHSVAALKAAEIVAVLDRTHAYRDQDSFGQLLLVCEADSRGRGVLKEKSFLNYPQAQVWRIMLAECCEVQAKTWVDQGLEGTAIKEALYQARVARVQGVQQRLGTA